MRKSFLALVIMYGMIVISLFFWQLCAEITEHPANPRYYAIFQEERGTIYDRNGLALASSIGSEEVYQRKYAEPSLSHTVGYFHQRYGITGLERLYHEELIGGRSVFTTLDLKLQQVAAAALGNSTGAVVAVNPVTGGILALVSSPWVDANTLEDNWPDYLADLRSPFLNRATQGLYPPGSVVKPIVYAAAMQDELVTLDDIWQDSGVLNLGNRTISNHAQRAHGSINLDQALAYSSNVIFAQLAIALNDTLLDYFRDFGLGHEMTFELRNASGHVPEKIGSDYDAAQLGIGQGELLVTPLQMAMVASTIANGGFMVRPFLTQEIRGGLKMRQITRPQILADIIPPDIAADIKNAMAYAAQQGTARTSVSDELHYAGKTGTAQTNGGFDHAWFIGFAPVETPQVAIAVVVEHGGTGGQVAAPVGAEVLFQALQLGN